MRAVFSHKNFSVRITNANVSFSSTRAGLKTTLRRHRLSRTVVLGAATRRSQCQQESHNEEATCHATDWFIVVHLQQRDAIGRHGQNGQSRIRRVKGAHVHSLRRTH